jgi:hypothetical protein
MWKVLNSPIVVVIVAAILLAVVMQTRKPHLAGEMRGVYDELMHIAEDGASDAKKTKAIQDFAQELAKQMREGFSAGFKSADGEKENRDVAFLAVQEKLQIEGLKSAPSQWGNRQRHLATLVNNSDKAIGQIQLHLTYTRNGELLDVENKWLNEIKILKPGQSVAFDIERSLPSKLKEDELEAFTADKVDVMISGFDIKKLD